MKRYAYDYRPVKAINPDNGEIENAILKPTHFGGKPAISFEGFNMPNYNADDIAWEDNKNA